jgi:hypothetical protein
MRGALLVGEACDRPTAEVEVCNGLQSPKGLGDHDLDFNFSDSS